MKTLLIILPPPPPNELVFIPKTTTTTHIFGIFSVFSVSLRSFSVYLGSGVRKNPKHTEIHPNIPKLTHFPPKL